MNQRGGYTAHQAQIEARAAATLRALAQTPSADLRGRRVYANQQRLHWAAPHLLPDGPVENIAKLRALSDGAALNIRFSDHDLHRAHQPGEATTRLIYDLLEQLRVESLAPTTYPGIRTNLRTAFTHWSERFSADGLHETGFGLLLFSVLQIVWARLNDCPVVEGAEDTIEATRAGLAPLIGTDLAALKRHRNHQPSYLTHSLRIANTLNDLLAQELDTAMVASARTHIINDSLARWLDTAPVDDTQFAAVISGNSRTFAAEGARYRIFTKAYDRTVSAADLVRSAQLQSLRAELDAQLEQSPVKLGRVVRALRRLFFRPQPDGWDSDLDHGYIDGSRLARFVASPHATKIFKNHAKRLHTNVAVSVLIDCSGSMKVHTPALAQSCDLLARAFRQLHVPFELLGFSTASWNGGKARAQWQVGGSPPTPGRLAEALHIVFADAGAPWAKARNGIAALLKTDYFREGIDGEAVTWAAQRLLEHEVERRILLVISDGCPTERATAAANDEFYLDNHLKSVVQRLNEEGEVEIYGVGVGMDLSPYYPRHRAIDIENGLDTATIDSLIDLLQSPVPRR